MSSSSAPWLEWFSCHLSPSQLLSRMKRWKRRPKQQCLPPPQPYPWLLYFSGKFDYDQTFCSISDPTKTYSTSIPELRELKVCDNNLQHGWCLRGNFTSTQLFVWNPSNLEKILLPPFKLHYYITIVDWVLSSSPTATDQVCSIFLFSCSSTSSNSIFYCQLGDEQWTEVDYHEDLVRGFTMKGEGYLIGNFTFLINPVYCNGRLYAGTISCDSTLVLIGELQPNGFKLMSTPVFMPTLLPVALQLRITKFLGSNNELFRVEIVLYAQDKVTAIAVYRFICSLCVWEKVESIKDRVFFISGFYTFSAFQAIACQAINPETEGGRIYIALKDNNFVYIYNIEDKSLMISQPFSNLPEKRSFSRWFMPDMGMADTTLKEEIGKAYQIREKESTCCAIHLKETGDKDLNEFALPLDVVELIAKRLINVIDYLHFRATNRLFCLAAPPVQWRSSSPMSMSRFDDLSLSPLFVFSEKDNVFTFVHPKHGLKYKYIINLPEVNVDGEFWNLLSDCEICYSKDGWLLLLALDTSFSFFFNPFTKKVLPLAFWLGAIKNTRCVGFSQSPTSSECVIVEIDQISGRILAHINFLGEDEWYDFEFEGSKFPLYNIGPTFHNGLFYYLSIKGKLAVIEVIGREASWKEFDKPQAPCTGYFNSFLVECDGNLLSVFEGPYGKWVLVFKLNESTMTWIKVKSLENHMLFVGNTSFSAVANIPGMENKIYFSRFYGQSIVLYSLETKNYHTFENKVVNFHRVREHLNSSWIESRWH